MDTYKLKQMSILLGIAKGFMALLILMKSSGGGRPPQMGGQYQIPYKGNNNNSYGNRGGFSSPYKYGRKF